MLAVQRSGRILLATMLFGLSACEGSTGPTGPTGPFLLCAQVSTISRGETKNGTLSTSDCNMGDGSYVDFYRFTLSSAATVTITMRSSSIDSYLFLYSEAQMMLDSDDDSGFGVSGTDSQIVFPLSAGNYVIAANSFAAGETGSYTVSLVY